MEKETKFMPGLETKEVSAEELEMFERYFCDQARIIAQTIETELKLLKYGYEQDENFQDYLIATEAGSFLCGDGLKAGEEGLRLGVIIKGVTQKNIQGFLAPKGTNNLAASLELSARHGKPVNPEAIESARSLMEMHNHFVETVNSMDKRLKVANFFRDKDKQGCERLDRSDIPEEIQRDLADLKEEKSFVTSSYDLLEEGYVDVEKFPSSSVIPEIFHKVIVTKPELLPILEEHVVQMAGDLRKFADLVKLGIDTHKST